MKVSSNLACFILSCRLPYYRGVAKEEEDLGIWLLAWQLLVCIHLAVINVGDY